MRTATLKLYSLEYNQTRTYLVGLLFIVGNILLPQLCHLVHLGGPTWLPIYFFTLIGAYKYGWRVGLLTAIISPIINSVAFGMPATAALPAILLKSILLAGAAGYTAAHFRKASIGLMVSVVLVYQVIGTLGEWAMIGSFYEAIQDFRLGIPGFLVQIFGGWFFINFLIRS